MFYRDNYGNRKARMPVDRYASEYNMNHPKRGLALIFNHEHFEIPQLKARTGTNVDCENFASTLKCLDFDVRVYKDLKLREVQKEVERGKLIAKWYFVMNS